MFVFNLIFFLLQPVQANYLDHTFLTEPKVVVRRDNRHVPLASVCAEMKYNYIQEMTLLRNIKAQLDWAAQQPITDQQAEMVKALKEQIQTSVDHLVFLAKPEWNEENLEIYLSWEFPQESRIYPQKIEVMSLYYKGEPAVNLAPLITISSGGLMYNSRGTLLEACQFIPTLEIEVRMQYKWFPRSLCPDDNDPDIRQAILTGTSNRVSRAYFACQTRPPFEGMVFLKGRVP